MLERRSIMANQLPAIKHIVQLMLENRSFDQMLGFLYAGSGNRSPINQPYEGLTGNETNPDDAGRPVKVFKIDANAPHPYLMPGADPGEGFYNTQLSAVLDRRSGAGFGADQPGLRHQLQGRDPIR
jgi:phospholipase C